MRPFLIRIKMKIKGFIGLGTTLLAGGGRREAGDEQLTANGQQHTKPEDGSRKSVVGSRWSEVGRRGAWGLPLTANS
jgi:hypothetical protein